MSTGEVYIGPRARCITHSCKTYYSAAGMKLIGSLLYTLLRWICSLKAVAQIH